MICTVFADLSYGHIKLIPSIERGIVNKIPGTLERSGFQGFFCRGSILALPHQIIELPAASELAEGQKCLHVLVAQAIGKFGRDCFPRCGGMQGLFAA